VYGAAFACAWGLLGGGFLASFASVVAWRVPRGQSLLAPSRCPACGRRLRAWELLPVISWLALRGRCGTCGAAIPARELAAELGGMAGGVAVAASWGVSWTGLYVALFGAGLLAAALADAERREVPTVLFAALAGLWLAAVAAARARLGVVVAPQPLLGAGVMLAVSAFAALVTRGRYGGADWLADVLLGLFLGPTFALVAWFGANALAAPWALAGRLRGRAALFPFLPALAAVGMLFALPAAQLAWLHWFPYVV
jgi:leader peptidase (prepilin peptidase)/N-methyltransferase